MTTCEELGVEAGVRGEVEKLLNELQQLLIGINIMQDLTARAKDSLVSFGERLSTRIFASFLRAQVRACGLYLVVCRAMFSQLLHRQQCRLSMRIFTSFSARAGAVRLRGCKLTHTCTRPHTHPYLITPTGCPRAPARRLGPRLHNR